MLSYHFQCHRTVPALLMAHATLSYFLLLGTGCVKIYSELSISPCLSLQDWYCPNYYFLKQEGDFETKWIQTF